MNVQPHKNIHNSANNPDQGLEILLDLAKTGEIDPWDVDIVKVADEYLKAVAEIREETMTEQTGLKITGKMLLYLAILLRMKSDKLAGIDYLEPAPEEAFLEELLDGDIDLDGRGLKNRMGQMMLPYTSLDQLIQRRTSTKEKRIRRVTLEDLIVELKKYEELERKRSMREKVEKDDHRRMTDYSHLTSDDIEELAHEEFIEDTILRLKEILERLLVHNEQISLTELMEAGRIDKVSAFLALLFLAARGVVDMHQEEFYAELYVSYEDDKPLEATG